MMTFKCAKIIKETMEEKYGGLGSWQVNIAMYHQSLIVAVRYLRWSSERALE